MDKKRYERPIIRRLNTGVMNKFGTRTEYEPVTHIDDNGVSDMIEEYGLDYANKVFAHLEEGDIYWDAFNHVGEQRPRNNDDDLDEF